MKLPDFDTVAKFSMIAITAVIVVEILNYMVWLWVRK